MSVISRAIILYLIFIETIYYLDSKLVFKFVPDTDMDTKLKIHIDITVATPCSSMTMESNRQLTKHFDNYLNYSFHFRKILALTFWIPLIRMCFLLEFWKSKVEKYFNLSKLWRNLLMNTFYTRYLVGVGPGAKDLLRVYATSERVFERGISFVERKQINSNI